MATHYIVRCDDCDKVIRQCRCPSWGNSKPVMYETCDECKTKEKEDGNTERDN